MKLDVYIRLIDAGTGLDAGAGGLRSASGSAARRSSASRARIDVDIPLDSIDGDILQRSDQEVAYSVKLSGDSRSASQQLSEVVLDQNAEKSRQPFTENWKDTPIALTSALQKPQSNFEDFFKEMLNDPRRLLQSHRELDRNRVLQFLAG